MIKEQFKSFSVRVYSRDIALYKSLCKKYNVKCNENWNGTTYYYGVTSQGYHYASNNYFGNLHFKNIVDFCKHLKQFNNKSHELWS